jgi:hypothetical protein
MLRGGNRNGARILGLISVNYFRIGMFLCGQNLF